MNELTNWIEQVSGAQWYWYVKYLSGNDTLANGSHQAGPYIPRAIISDLFPSLSEGKEENPRAEFGALIDSHGTEVWLTAIWYNNRLRGGTRNECRITNWGGASSPLLDPDATGSLCVLAFHKPDGRDVDVAHIWLCRSLAETEAIIDRVGPVEPGRGVVHNDSGLQLGIQVGPPDRPCRLAVDEIEADWLLEFPDALRIVQMAVGRLSSTRNQSPDVRLLRRRDCEYEIFLSIEEAIVLPRLKQGFDKVDTFVDFANAVTNRRKARSGKSLELHAREVFREEKLAHSHGQTSEAQKRPDFLFPSAEAYRNGSYPTAKLRMLAAKTTCKDRWRQILNEADRIQCKHLLTLQEGISPNQFAEMKNAGVVLVVPARLHESYHRDIRPELISLETFIEETRVRCT